MNSTSATDDTAHTRGTETSGGAVDEGSGSGGRVVFITQHYPPEQGGAASRIRDTATSLARDGWDVTVLAPPPCYPFGEYERSWRRHERRVTDGVSVHRLWTWQPAHRDPGAFSRLPYFLLFVVHAVWWLVRQRREYDALVTTTPPVFTGLAGLVGSLFVPWVVDVRDLWIDNAVAFGYIAEGGVAERATRWLQRTVLGRADTLTVTTASLGAAVAERYGDDLRERTTVVPNGVDTDVFSPGDGHDPAEPVVVYTGALGRAQDLETVITAISHLDGVRLRLVGSGDAESSLRALSADLGIRDRVEFVGLVERNEVPDVLNRAQVAVAPILATEELAYAMPSKVYEYLACGLPSVLLGRGEVERFAANSSGCIHVESEPEQVALALEGLLSDAERRREMARAGREEATQQYSRTATARRLGATLRALIRADGNGYLEPNERPPTSDDPRQNTEEKCRAGCRQ